MLTCALDLHRRRRLLLSRLGSLLTLVLLPTRISIRAAAMMPPAGRHAGIAVVSGRRTCLRAKHDLVRGGPLCTVSRAPPLPQAEASETMEARAARGVAVVRRQNGFPAFEERFDKAKALGLIDDLGQFPPNV